LCWIFLRYSSSWTICLGGFEPRSFWSLSWVARIIGVSHWCLAHNVFEVHPCCCISSLASFGTE
jgi:hypothetical protein